MSLDLGIFTSIVAFVALQRFVELRIAKRNEAWARTQGAQEHGADHYPLFFVLHIGWAAGWLLEAYLGGLQLAPLWMLWMALFVAAQLLRVWSLASLGTYWNTRILVIPGHPRIQKGPYRWIPHPNYLVVAVELLVIPLLFGAWLAALVASLLNAALLLGVRIPAENEALRLLQDPDGS